MSTCRSCAAEVAFVPSAKSGKPMILDAVPTKGVVMVADNGRTLLDFADVAKAAVVNVYTDHHATCPRASDWKR